MLNCLICFLRPGRDSYNTTSRLRLPRNIICIYKLLFIFNILTNEIMGPILFPIQTLVTFCIITCNVCLIKFSELLDFKGFLLLSSLGASCTVTWISVLWVVGMAYKISLGKIATLQRQCDVISSNKWGYASQDRKYFKKALKSLKPLQMKIGLFYSIRMVRTLKFIHLIIWATMKTLLIFHRLK